MLNILLAFFVCLVIRLIGKRGLIRFALTGQTVTQMRETTSFHCYFISFVLGTIGFYATLTVALAFFVKEYFL